MNILFLDDDQTRWNVFKVSHPDAIWVKTAQACMDELQNHDWDEVHLDHDLNNEVYCDTSRSDTGSEVVRFIESHPLNANTQFTVHSLNSTASLAMIKKLRELGYSATYQPFGSNFDINRERLITALCNGEIPGLENVNIISIGNEASKS